LDWLKDDKTRERLGDAKKIAQLVRGQGKMKPLSEYNRGSKSSGYLGLEFCQTTTTKPYWSQQRWVG